jgi:hypothetical protein
MTYDVNVISVDENGGDWATAICIANWFTTFDLMRVVQLFVELNDFYYSTEEEGGVTILISEINDADGPFEMPGIKFIYDWRTVSLDEIRSYLQSREAWDRP